MKQLSLSLLFVALCCAQVAFAATPINGRVINSKQEPVGYATVVALADSTQVAGATTDEKGRFSLTLADGDYTLLVDFVGYKSHEQKISIPRDTNLGDITLAESATDIDEVVVKAQLIRREADRFVVDVANSDMALGKDGEELLRQSPGVWIDDEKISINGASGTKVYINEREVKLSGMQLVNYIKNLRAENCRAEQLGEKFDYVVSRAVTEMSRFMPWAWSLLRSGQRGTLPNGILYLKGGDLAEELAATRRRWDIHEIGTMFEDEFFDTKRVVYTPFKR